MAMDGNVSRISVDGLRTSDPTVLSVMIQDIINKPIDKLSIQTLCDLVSLTEIEGLNRSLDRDLGRFREKMAREFNDIPVGNILNDHLERLAKLPTEQVPSYWREVVLDRSASTDLDSRSAEQLTALAEAFKQHPAEVVSIAESPTVKVQHAATRAAAANSGLQKRLVGGTPAGPRKRAPAKPRTPAIVRDPERAQWIRDDILDRLSNYGSKGLKQVMLIIGARKRAPWDDLGEDEIMAVLKDLLKNNRVSFSAGRWSMRGRSW